MTPHAKKPIMGTENADSPVNTLMRMTTTDVSKLRAGEELDALIARIVFDGTRTLRYSTDLNAAWSVRERMEELGWDSEDHQTGAEGKPSSYVFRFIRWQDKYGKYLSKPVSHHTEVATIQDAPFAICTAAIKALLSLEDRHD